MRLPLHADEELAGPVPEGMFTLRHVSHSVCRDTGMENRTLATTLSGCATRCLLVNRESGSRTCSHFGWIPRLRECFIYPSCTRRELYGEKVKLYEKSAPRPSQSTVSAPMAAQSPCALSDTAHLARAERTQMWSTCARRVRASAWSTSAR